MGIVCDGNFGQKIIMQFIHSDKVLHLWTFAYGVCRQLVHNGLARSLPHGEGWHLGINNNINERIRTDPIRVAIADKRINQHVNSFGRKLFANVNLVKIENDLLSGRIR